MKKSLVRKVVEETVKRLSALKEGDEDQLADTIAAATGVEGEGEGEGDDGDVSPGSKTISKMDKALGDAIMGIIKSKGASLLNQRLSQVDKQSERYAVAIMLLRDLLLVPDEVIQPFDNQLWQAMGRVKGRAGFEGPA